MALTPQSIATTLSLMANFVRAFWMMKIKAKMLHIKPVTTMIAKHTTVAMFILKKNRRTGNVFLFRFQLNHFRV